ncbi:MAG TPA: glycosyltransferase family 2 protein [Blastocatellia bacterium]|nr:glycosyltransferase family 2 protein [Blastocatellia bacterium]
MKTPVALIIFNRPDCTARVLEAIARERPEKLLVIADGPRPNRPDDVERCEATRALIERVDWSCEVLTNYSDHNLGCKLRPQTGVDWVFEQCEEALIFEDDCLPHPSFFPFCEELLERYRDDERVMMVGGVNFLGRWRTPSQSYYFSYLGATWGWASWRRAWRLNDPELKGWPQILEARILEHLFPNPRHSAYWKDIFQQVYDGRLDDVWDYQWLLSCWINSGFRIFPEVNLISNIGFRDDATHTFGDSPVSNMAVSALTWPLEHPEFMTRSVQADTLIQEKVFCTPDHDGRARNLTGRARTLAGRIKGGIKGRLVEISRMTRSS